MNQGGRCKLIAKRSIARMFAIIAEISTVNYPYCTKCGKYFWFPRTKRKLFRFSLLWCHPWLSSWNLSSFLQCVVLECSWPCFATGNELLELLTFRRQQNPKNNCRRLYALPYLPNICIFRQETYELPSSGRALMQKHFADLQALH